MEIGICGPGKLFFRNNECAAVKCDFWQTESGGLRGTVLHAEGYPYWHPILSLHPPGPYRLVMSDGRSLKVTFRNLLGDVEVEPYPPSQSRS